jgi:serine/threonine protein kinase
MTDESLSLEPGAVIAGKYRVDALLGKGGMGAVFLATNTSIGRHVAIKVLSSKVAGRVDLRRRFELEARSAALIGHPGIVDVLDMGQTSDGEPFIVMEYLEGATLKAVLKRLGRFSPAQVVGVACPVLDALASAHRAGVVHRDVKPANIFVCARPTQTMKLLDFGVSRFGKSSGLTLSGTAMGTPKYMAPEQVLGDPDLGPEVDLYALGAVMYCLMTGRPPYEADSDMATLARILHDNHQPLHQVRPDVHPELCAVVDTLLSKDPAHRPREAAIVRARLMDIVPLADTATLFAAAALAVPVPAPAPAPSSVEISLESSRRPQRQRAEVAPPRPPPQPSAKSTQELDAAPGVFRPSTQQLDPVRPPRRAKLVVAGVLSLLSGATLALWALNHPGDEQPPAATVSVSAPVARAPTTFAATLSAMPATARFTIDGQATDCNPCTLTRDAGTTTHVSVRAVGYAARELELVFDRDRAQELALVAAPATAQTIDAGPQKPGHARGKRSVKNNLDVDERDPYLQ